MSTPPYPIAGVAAGKLSTARWLLLTASLVSLALWYIPGVQFLLYPIRLFVTFIHEGGHALMTVLTGGGVVKIEVLQNTSGVTLSRGGNPFLIFMAGYLGATLFGAICLQLVRSKEKAQNSLIFMAGVILIITGLWVHPFGDGIFGFVTGICIGLGLAAASRFLSKQAAAFVVSFLSVQLCLNAFFDLRDLVWMTTSSNVPNDAVFMAREYGLTPWFWAILWAGIAAVILGVSLRAFWKGSRA
jgi:hypothetical protein